MNTEDIAVFNAAVSAGSLAAAARRLGIAPMEASRRLANLELTLGARLLHRTTRSLSLTAEGETFLPYAQNLLESEQEAKAVLRADTGEATGLLRVSASVAFGIKFIAPIVPKLLARHPELRLSLDLTDAMPDLVATGTDLAIRIAKLRDSSLIAQKLVDSPRVLVASPAYLAQHGVPTSTEELIDHICLPLAGRTHWTFIADGRERQVRLSARFYASTAEGCHAACRAGAGIALLAHWNVVDQVQSGQLMPIELKDAVPDGLTVWAVYPSTRLLPHKVRIFIAELRHALAAAGVTGPTA